MTPDGRLPVTAVVAARNEAANLATCLSSLGPAARVLVVDSGSADATAAIAAAAGAEVVQFRYEGGYPKKRQWALDTIAITTPWILLVDADEAVPEPLWRQIARATGPDGGDTAAYLVRKAFHFMGRRFRFGGFSHAAVLLFRRGRARFERLVEDDAGGLDMEVHERLIVDGAIGRLSEPLLHSDAKGIAAYLDRHNRYSTWEARLRHNLFEARAYGREAVPANPFGNLQERRRFLKRLAVRVPVEPLWWFLYHYVLRLGFLEGRRGLIAAQIRMCYIQQVRAKMYEMRLARAAPRRPPDGAGK